MSRLWAWAKAFGRFWYGFVIGDDWTIAAGVVTALGLTYGLYRAPDVPAWWSTPLVGAVVVALAVRRANARDAD